jgi:hypothetical protein
LIASARNDPRINAAAVTGSASIGREDRWSDIDLAFGLEALPDMEPTMADWTKTMYDTHAALDHLDVLSGATVYRVFILPNTLQVDLAFSPPGHFAARGPTFKLVFGDAAQMPLRRQDARELVGWGWLYALHVRSALARGRVWQAEYMISKMRDQVMALACLRLNLPTRDGRGFDDLDDEFKFKMSNALVGLVAVSDLARAFGVAVEALISETNEVDVDLSNRIASTLQNLVPSSVEPTSH